MNFLIADTFQSSLARLTGAEQKAAKTAAFDLQLDPAGKGKSLGLSGISCAGGRLIIRPSPG